MAFNAANRFYEPGKATPFKLGEEIILALNQGARVFEVCNRFKVVGVGVDSVGFCTRNGRPFCNVAHSVGHLLLSTHRYTLHNKLKFIWEQFSDFVFDL